MAALNVQYLKPQNLIDSETQSAIDPTNPLVYIKASNRESANLLQLIKGTPIATPMGHIIV